MLLDVYVFSVSLTVILTVYDFINQPDQFKSKLTEVKDKLRDVEFLYGSAIYFVIVLFLSSLLVLFSPAIIVYELYKRLCY